MWFRLLHSANMLAVTSVHAAPAVLSDTVPLVVSRQLLTAFAQGTSQLPPEPQKEVAEL